MSIWQEKRKFENLIVKKIVISMTSEQWNNYMCYLRLSFLAILYFHSDNQNFWFNPFLVSSKLLSRHYWLTIDWLNNKGIYTSFDNSFQRNSLYVSKRNNYIYNLHLYFLNKNICTPLATSYFSHSVCTNKIICKYYLWHLVRKIK